tara:strand:- start:832 stop:1275 length:444 start_codon:yes stop_codon:yes gene_type:complete
MVQIGGIKPVYLNVVVPSGSTEILSQKVFESIEENVGNYRVVASATKCGIEVDSVPAVFFDGGIAIYHLGHVPGTDAMGIDFITQGRLRGTIPGLDPQVREGGLLHYIFRDEFNGGRVEQILRGYSLQGKARGNANFIGSLRGSSLF